MPETDQCGLCGATYAVTASYPTYGVCPWDNQYSSGEDLGAIGNYDQVI